MRVGSVRTMLSPLARNSWNPYAETIVNNAEPSDTSRCVRMPASRSRISRSKPIAAPSTHAIVSRSSASHPSSDGMLLTRCIDRLLLECRELVDPAGGEVEQLVEPLARERNLLRGRLHLDEAPVARHDHVDVDVRIRVLRVVEVEQRDVSDDTDGDGGDGSGQRLRKTEAVERARRGDVGTGDGRATGAAVCLEHVAVEVHGPLAERLEV